MLNNRRTNKAEYLNDMVLVAPWHKLVSLIDIVVPQKSTEIDLYDVPPYRAFTALGNTERLPDRSSILRFGKTPKPLHFLKEHQLAQQILTNINATMISKGLMLKNCTSIDAILTVSPSPTKNHDSERSPEMHQTKKENQWHFEMKSQIGVDTDSGLMHSVVSTPANVNDVTQEHKLLHGVENDVIPMLATNGPLCRENLN